jgi:4-hydroxy-3-methylbut-2-enyl diphosphate reductase
MEETTLLGNYILGKLSEAEFLKYFSGRYSHGFDPILDLTKFGVVNQTTQLATDTQAISDYLKKIIIEKYGVENIEAHFADTRDTLCYATNDNQSAVIGLLETSADLAIVMGGKNSSNSSHLVELCEQKLPTYFIDDVSKVVSESEIIHADCKNKTAQVVHNYLPQKETVKILMTSGASCPDAVVEYVIQKIAGYFGKEAALDQLILEWEKHQVNE